MLQKNVDITAYTSFAVKTKAAACAEFHTISNLEALLYEAKQFSDKTLPLILGGGSNMLFIDNYPGVVLRNQVQGISEEFLPGSKVSITCGGGVNWHELVMYCVRKNYGGIENLALIPGSCGAAPIQNIGAYGVELTDVFHSLQAWHLQEGGMASFNHRECNFGYRDSVFKRKYKGQFAICSVTLILDAAPKVNLTYAALKDFLLLKNIHEPTVEQVADAVISIRQSKLPDPKQIGNAGSFFKNPVVASEQFEALMAEHPSIPHFAVSTEAVKIPAAWLIEQCGWKGFREGDAGVHKNQALVLVNYGNASGEELFRLSERIVQSVHQRFNILLEREVNII